jgi:hypothetical protein
LTRAVASCYSRVMKSSLRGISALVFFGANLLFAQASGRITGVVTDPTDAVVQSAHVIATNTRTQIKLETVTNQDGIFQFPELPIGSYEITATAPGFKTLGRGPIELLTGHTIDLRLSLQIGEAAQTTQVTADAPMVQSASSEVQTTMETRSMQDLPLNGRNALQLVVLTPGTQLTGSGTIGGQQDNTGVSVNGLRATDNNFRLDGASYTNKHFDSAPTLPNPDTLGEFTVQSSNFSARESGAGAVVQLSTRSGTNGFHGSAFEFLRNDKLDARNFFNAAKLPFHRNQYGGTFGGPVRKDRTFFFGAYQGSKQRGAPSPKTLIIPTPAQRAGDFSALGKAIVDPLTGQPFLNAVIPTNRFDPIAVKLLDIIPLGNLNGRLVVPPNSNLNDDQFLVKVDHVISDRNHLSGRYFWDRYQFQRDTGSIPGIFASNLFNNQSALARDSYILNSATVMTSSFSYSRNFRIQSIPAPFTLQELGAQVPLANDLARKEIRVNINGYVNVFGGGPLELDPETWEGHVEFSHTHGRHLLQFGGGIERNHEYALDVSNGSGSWNYNGQRTSSTAIARSGDSFADFLLGLPNQFTQLASTPQDIVEMKYNLWFQDDWKISSRFTLNAGLRWEPWLPASDARGPIPGWLPGVHSTLAPNAPTGLVFSGDPGVPNSVLHKDFRGWAPRLGFAWNPNGDGKTIVRGAFGFFNRMPPLNVQRFTSSTAAFRGLQVSIDSPLSTANPYGNFPGGAPYPFNSVPVSQLGSFKFTLPVVSSVLDPLARHSYTESWNLTLERQLVKDLSVSVAYVGNHSAKILAATEANPAIYAPGATTANTAARRAYPGIGPTTLFTPFQDEHYEGMQIAVTKRAGHGVSVVANYVWSKTIDNNSGGTIGSVNVINAIRLSGDRAVADFDVTHRANIALVYDLPKITKNAAFGRLVNDWHFNSIVTAQSGLPFSVKSGRDNSFSGVNSDNADQIASASRPAGVDQLAEWFNTAAFTVNTIGTFGSSGRNALRGPGLINFDLSTFKRIPVTERVTTEFRAEFFNVLNHANFLNPVANLSNVNFGRILSAGDPRVIQFALKLVF